MTRVAITEASGRRVVGVVQGAGGIVAGDAVARLRGAIERANEGRPLGIYEPVDGCVVVYPEYNALGQGSRVIVNLRGARVEPATDGDQWNPRYLAYCAAHGFAGDPGGMCVRDSERYPGGRMAGFMMWTGERWRAWDKQRPVEFGTDREVRTPEEHAAFDRWLAGAMQAPARPQQLELGGFA